VGGGPRGRGVVLTVTRARRSLNRLSELLLSPHLDVRIAAGEALAVIFELGRDFADDYEQEWALDLIDILKDLATDSNKYRAKKDRKQQRASFRDILRYIEVRPYLSSAATAPSGP
jgi:hypothetical protein